MEDEVKKNWDSLCLDSIREEKVEIAKRYNIRFGQTEIYCSRCVKSIGNPLNHNCQDIRLKKLNEAKSDLKKTPELCLKLKKLGAKKASVMLYKEKKDVVFREVSERAVRGWIQRGNIPIEYQEVVRTL